ncbi:MAG: cytochrome c oxidase subunit II [Calditrichia bacterium]
MSGASTTTGAVDTVFWFIIGVSAFFLFLITFLMIYFIFKYSRKKNKKPENIHGNVTLEIVWTVIPTIIVMVMFYLGYKGFDFLRTVPDNALEVQVTARMWSWLFEYDNGVVTDTLYVPVDTPVKLNLKSEDVIHSFYVPAFRIKEDAVPGLPTYLWFEATQPGDYHVLCAEYCGLQHSAMLTSIKVLPAAEYEQWMARMAAVAEKPADSGEKQIEKAKSNMLSGKRIVQIKGCMACHSTDGSKIVGPTFKGLYGHSVELADGRTLTADENYLRKAIMEPGEELVKGYNNLMPNQSKNITEEELVAIIQYIKGLK